MTEDVPASTRIAEAQDRRVRRHAGLVRVKILTGLALAAFLLGVLAGCMAPGA